MNFCLDCDRPLEDNDGELCHICADRRESMREEEFRRLEEEAEAEEAVPFYEARLARAQKWEGFRASSATKEVKGLGSLADFFN